MKKLLILLGISTIPILSYGYTLYVSPNGNDSNTGDSTNAPFRTIQKAVDVGQSNIVMLMDGVYSNSDAVFVKRDWTTIKAVNRWKARVTCPNNVGIYSDNADGMTVDGVEVAYCKVDAIKFASLSDPKGHYGTVRNCWIHDNGTGYYSQPTDEPHNTAQGIGAHSKNYMLFENNLIERNGRWFRHDHGIYFSGHHVIIRNNIIRENLAFGIQNYENSPYVSYANEIYNNLIYNNGRGMYFQTLDNTNVSKIYNNTVIVTNIYEPPINFRISGTWEVHNNIVYGGSVYTIGSDDLAFTGVINEDYNVGGNAANLLGAHDLVIPFTQAGFVNTNDGLYFIKTSARAATAGDNGTYPPITFWGTVQYSTPYAGAFVPHTTYNTDTRDLYTPGPSPAYKSPVRYAAASGLTSGYGTFADSPWPLGYAISNCPAGGTVVVLDGLYNLTGAVINVTQPVDIIAQNKWGAVITNNSDHTLVYYSGASGSTLDGLAFKMNRYDVMFDGDEGISNCIIRNCWFRDTGVGYAASSSASGIEIRGTGMLIENCLSEYNGTNNVGQNHGIYIGGTNNIVRNNVCRYNGGAGIILNGHGIQLDYENNIYGNLCYNNLSQGYQISVKSDSAGYSGTNYVNGNTTIEPVNAYAMLFEVGTHVKFTNNIILAQNTSIAGVWYNAGVDAVGNYNLSTYPIRFSGPSDTVSTAPYFTATNSGLFWLTSTSPARFNGLNGVDIGAYQHSTTREADTRVLDPSTTTGADYWYIYTNITYIPSDYWQSLVALPPPPFIPITDGVIMSGGG